MPPKRPPAPPPQIPGFSFDRVLGSGGFSDVYLYTQQMPRRQVAVKVLLAHASGASAREQFVAEANLMAQLATHPYIVTIYQADTAADGRPYLVMEYCPRPNLAQRYHAERIGVAEAIRVGIRLSGAVETAHRIGILHRDIKPANVLTTGFGFPALTDFGISVLSSAISDGEDPGMSPPFAAPEFFVDGIDRGVAGDIYSLAATVYTLLKGASPFEDPGGANSYLDLSKRVLRNPVPPIGRPDVPPSLESVLVRAMSKRPDARYPSAAAFGRALQRVEQEMQLSQTSLDLPDMSWAHVEDETTDDLRTRARMVTTVHPGAPGPHDAGSAVDPTMPPGARYQTYDQRQPVAPDAPAPPLESRRRWLALLASSAVVVAILTVVVIGALNSPDVPLPTSTQTTTQPVPQDTDIPVGSPPPPENLAGKRVDGAVVFTWDAPEWDGKLSYVWKYQGQDGSELTIQETTLEVSDPGTVCVEVASRSEAGTLSDYVSECVS